MKNNSKKKNDDIPLYYLDGHIMDVLEQSAIIAKTDKDGVITDVNDFFCDITQYSKKELVGNTYALLNSGVHPSSFFSDLWETITAGRIWHGKICNRAKDGSLYWVRATIVPEKDEDGNVVGYFEISIDITLDKIVSILMAAQKSALQSIAHGSDLSFACQPVLEHLSEIDPDLKISILKLREGKYLHKVASIGLSKEYLDALEMLEIGPDVGSCGAAAYQKKAVFVEDVQKHPYWSNFKKLALDAGLGSCWSVPICDENNTVMGTIAMYAQTSRMASKAEQILLDKTAQTAAVLFLVHEERRYYYQQNEKLKNLINTSPSCIHELDLQGRFVSINSSGLKMVQAENEKDVLGKKYMSFAHTQEERDMIKRLFSEALAGKETHFEYQAHIKGKWRYFSSYFAPLRDVDGKIYSIMGVADDITQRYLVQQQLEHANEELEEFTYRTSHDLRSPLVSSINLIEVIETSIKKGDTEQALGCLSMVHDALHKLERLVGDILVLTEVKNKPEEIRSVDISSLIKESLDKLTYLEGFKSVDIQLDLGFKDDFYVKKMRLQTIIDNLLSNAIKYRDINKAQSYIKVKTYEEDGFLILEVEDNGLGIPIERRGKLFKMFQRFHPRASFGSGLGLYLVKKSADSINATISYEEHKDGSIFRLKVPMDSGRSSDIMAA